MSHQDMFVKCTHYHSNEFLREIIEFVFCDLISDEMVKYDIYENV